MTDPLLEVQNLHVSLPTYLGPVKAVRGVSFHISTQEKVALVGESGCGKSVTAQSLMQLTSGAFQGHIFFEGQDLLQVPEETLRGIRGRTMGMIFQDPMTSLNPTLRVGQQITEGLIHHQLLSHPEAMNRSVELLEEVGIPDAQERVNQYPHEFSGGMRQRVMIAIAMACRPKLLIADEPTTALDVTIQAQILDLLERLNQDMGMSLLLITHDLAVVASTCDRVLVMYAGEIVEEGPVDRIFYQPQHPYTRALLNAVPNPEEIDRQRLDPIEGAPPNLLKPPSGCAFHPRCPFAMEVCRDQSPPFQEGSACWLRHPQAPSVADFNVKRWESA